MHTPTQTNKHSLSLGSRLVWIARLYQHHQLQLLQQQQEADSGCDNETDRPTDRPSIHSSIHSFIIMGNQATASSTIATTASPTCLSRAVARELIHDMVDDDDDDNNQEEEEEEEDASSSSVSVTMIHQENNNNENNIPDKDPTVGTRIEPKRLYQCSPALFWFARRPPLLTVVTTHPAPTTTAAAATVENEPGHQRALFSFCTPSSSVPCSFHTTTNTTTTNAATTTTAAVVAAAAANKASSPNSYHRWLFVSRDESSSRQPQRPSPPTVALRHTTRTNASSWSFSSLSSSSSSSSSPSPTSPAATTTTVSSSSLTYTPDELQLSQDPTPASNLRDTTKPVWIVTTATLPWFTGTAVNPLLRAAYLLRTTSTATSTTSTSSSSSRTTTMDQQDERNDPTNRSSLREVHLVVPWLTLAEDRVALYGEAWRHSDQAQQEAYLRQWLVQQNLSLAAQHLHMHFYPARYHATLSSIFAMGDLCLCLTQLATAAATTTTTTTTDSSITTTTRTTPCFDLSQAICILEEPEHVNFYRAPTASHSWRGTFAHVVGIVHTNYQAYARQSSALHGVVTGPLVGAVSAWMVRAYCDKVIKLSSVLQEYAIEKEVVANVHGIRAGFFAKRGQGPEEEAVARTGHDIYFIGKLLWAKGLDILLQELYPAYYKRTKQYFAMDVFGSGPDETEIQQAFLGSSTSVWLDQAENDGEDGGTTKNLPSKRNGSVATSTTMPLATLFRSSSLSSSSSLSLSSCSSASSASSSLWWKDPLPVRFRGPLDHAEISSQYKIFINPSVTEVLCTTTAEALAMGKFVICPKHPSNEFFLAFPNCLQYESPQQFVEMLQYAMNEQTLPEPLSPELQHLLSWPAATERLFEAAAVSFRDLARRERVGGRIWDERCAVWHEKLGKGRHGDVLRKVMGGGPVADQSKYRSEVLLSTTTTTTTTTDPSQASNEEQEVATTSISAVPVLVA